MLFGQLCLLDNRFTIKKVFTCRLMSYFADPAKARGFIPDIYRILCKYGLQQFLTVYRETGSFPNITPWKKSVKQAIHEKVEFDWKNRIISDASISDFILLHHTYQPCYIWQFSKIYKNMHTHCVSVFYFMCSYFSNNRAIICNMCGEVTDKIAVHKVLFCISAENSRHALWQGLCKRLGHVVFSELCSFPVESQLVELFSGFRSFDIADRVRVGSFKCFLLFVHSLKKYP